MNFRRTSRKLEQRRVQFRYSCPLSYSSSYASFLSVEQRLIFFNETLLLGEDRTVFESRKDSDSSLLENRIFEERLGKS